MGAYEAGALSCNLVITIKSQEICQDIPILRIAPTLEGEWMGSRAGFLRLAWEGFELAWLVVGLVAGRVGHDLLDKVKIIKPFLFSAAQQPLLLSGSKTFAWCTFSLLYLRGEGLVLCSWMRWCWRWVRFLSGSGLMTNMTTHIYGSDGPQILN